MEPYENDEAFVRALKARQPEAAEALLKGYGGLFKYARSGGVIPCG